MMSGENPNTRASWIEELRFEILAHGFNLEKRWLNLVHLWKSQLLEI